VVEVTAETIPKSTAPTTFRSINGFAVPSMIHNNQSLLSSKLLPPPFAALFGRMPYQVSSVEISLYMFGIGLA